MKDDIEVDREPRTRGGKGVLLRSVEHLVCAYESL